MNRFQRYLTAPLLGVLMLVGLRGEAQEASGDARRLAVATVNPVATDAAAAVFCDGGNAVDAAVTAALTLGVVDSHNSGLGGGCLILVRRPNGEFLAIDGREMAPAAAHRDMFIVDGKPDPSLSQTGPLASGTPGALAAYAALVDECGRLPLSRLLEPGMHAAAGGYVVSRSHASALRGTRKRLARFPASKETLLKPDGTAPIAGETIVNADLARTYRMIASEGPEWFYEGELAQRVGDWMASNRGLLTADDFASYKAKRREPVVSTYRGRTIVGFPPPSSGGVHVAQMLNTLEPFDVGAIFAESKAEGIHLVTEAMKLAFADRAHWLGDADFADVPRGLASKEYAASLTKRISRERASTVATHGEPPQWRQDLFGRHTTHIAAADSEGYWVAITATVNTSFGSKAMVPGTGLVLNNEMDDFAIHPGVPNAFGLVGAENNAVVAGKRPLSSMSPTIVLDEQGEPMMTLGAAGGPKIITQVLSMIIGVIDRGMTPGKAIAEPRFHHQWRPDKLRIETAADAALVEALRSKGHAIEFLTSGARVQVIAADGHDGFVAHFDPRIDGKAVVVSASPATQLQEPAAR